MDRKSAGELQKHMLGTYRTLRIVLTVIAFALPVVVAASGWFQQGRFWIGPSLSQYYYVTGSFPFFTARDLFVGGLLGAAASLYSYKGFSTRENIALNLAGIFAVFVAVLPTAAEGEPRTLRPILHATSAVLFFLCIAYVSIRRSRDTLRLLAPEKRDWYARRYFLTGFAMIISPVAAVVLSFVLDRESSVIFLVETLGVWAFAAYWLVKTREMHESAADERALDGVLQRERVAPILPGAVPGSSASAMDRAIRWVMVPDHETVERIVPANVPAPPTVKPSADAYAVK